MRYAICNEIFGDWPLAKACAYAAECGYGGIEIAPFSLAPWATDLSSKVRAEIRRTIARAGLECVGLHWLLAKTTGLHAVDPDPTHACVSRRTCPTVPRSGRPRACIWFAAAAEPVAGRLA